MRTRTAKVTLKAVRHLIEETTFGVDHDDAKDSLLELILCIDRNQNAHNIDELKVTWEAFLRQWKETQNTINQFIRENA